MRKFDTKVQHLKYKVLREVARLAFEDKLLDCYTEIPKMIVKGPEATMRCCIYKERAIVGERIRMALGGNKENPNVIEVIDIACDECPVSGYTVTESCRGCIAHRCEDVCKRGAISFDKHQRAVIDKEKCVECGACAKVCPYSAITNHKRPCENACKVKAISRDEKTLAASIDNDKCIACGACVYQCPFGAITDKSYILDVVNLIKGSAGNTNYRLYAVVAPSISSQFSYAKLGQVITGIERLGFHHVVEAALGADITLYHEAQEWKEKGVLTTSCCPSFVLFVEKNFPDLKKYVSSSVSPMVETAMLIKRTDPTGKVIFIGPCASKKLEYKQEKTKGAIDSVLSFEELQAFLDARDIEVGALEETALDNASFYGRIFAKSGGIAQGVADVAAGMGVEGIKPVAMNGIDECRANLLKLKMGRAAENFFEGMACDGGCLNGALCLNHGPKNVVDVDKYGASAKEKDIENSVKLYKLSLKEEEN